MHRLKNSDRYSFAQTSRLGYRRQDTAQAVLLALVVEKKSIGVIHPVGISVDFIKKHLQNMGVDFTVTESTNDNKIIVSTFKSAAICPE